LHSTHRERTKQQQRRDTEAIQTLVAHTRGAVKGGVTSSCFDLAFHAFVLNLSATPVVARECTDSGDQNGVRCTPGLHLAGRSFASISG
jgi:hypothetical protein